MRRPRQTDVVTEAGQGVGGWRACITLTGRETPLTLIKDDAGGGGNWIITRLYSRERERDIGGLWARVKRERVCVCVCVCVHACACVCVLCVCALTAVEADHAAEVGVVGLLLHTGRLPEAQRRQVVKHHLEGPL